MPKPVLIILIPIELARFFIVQPFTLGVRLFANMFAGHLLLLIFTLATWYLASFTIGLLFAAGSFAMMFFVFGLELLIDPAPGVHLHHADRRVHRQLAGVGTLTRRTYDPSGGTSRRYDM